MAERYRIAVKFTLKNVYYFEEKYGVGVKRDAVQAHRVGGTMRSKSSRSRILCMLTIIYHETFSEIALVVKSRIFENLVASNFTFLGQNINHLISFNCSLDRRTHATRISNRFNLITYKNV